MHDVRNRALRILQVIENLSHASHPQTLSQLAQRTAIPNASLRRLLEELAEQSYVTRMPGERGGFVTGPRCHQLGLSIVQTPTMLRACRSVLSKLVAITGETCNLNALSGDSVQYLARVESPGHLRLQLHMDIGSRVPLHCTASGKLFLALTPPADQERLLDRLPLEPMAPRTITDRKALESELRRIRSQEIGIDNEEFVLGMVAVAVPVHSRDGAAIAALACHAPTAQASLKSLLEHVGPMRKAAEELSLILSARQI